MQVANSFGSNEIDPPTVIVPPAAAPVQAASIAATDFQPPSPTLTDLHSKYHFRQYRDAPLGPQTAQKSPKARESSNIPQPPPHNVALLSL